MIATLEKPGRRKKLLDACIARQQFLIDDFKDRIKALTEREGPGNEEPYTNEDLANNAAKISEINTLNDLLEFANNQLELLENLKITQDLDRDCATLGAIVVTNHYTFFISASSEKFAVDGHVYVGISTYSPIYKAMEGKAKGETFLYKGTSYKIKDIF